MYDKLCDRIFLRVGWFIGKVLQKMGP